VTSSGLDEVEGSVTSSGLDEVEGSVTSSGLDEEGEQQLRF